MFQYISICHVVNISYVCCGLFCIHTNSVTPAGSLSNSHLSNCAQCAGEERTYCDFTESALKIDRAHTAATGTAKCQAFSMHKRNKTPRRKMCNQIVTSKMPYVNCAEFYFICNDMNALIVGKFTVGKILIYCVCLENYSNCLI